MTNYIIIPTAGRQEVIYGVIQYMLDFIPTNWSIIVVGSQLEDLPSKEALSKAGSLVEFFISDKGASKQRNFGLSKVIADADIVAFLDDDFLVSKSYFSVVQDFLSKNPTVVGLNVHLLGDGAKSAGITHADALALLDNSTPSSFSHKRISSLYGCNMVVRGEAVRQMEQWFDDSLPLYSWLEDKDFSFRLSKFGKFVLLGKTSGVHLGTKFGRTSGLRYGYSQIANPVYLYKKGTLSSRDTFVLLIKPIFANLIFVFFPESWIDRKGRLRGNIRGLLDLLMFRSSPSRILEFK